MTSAAVTGTLVRYSSTADGCLRITIELNELETVQFLERFGVGSVVVGAPIVIARVNYEVESTSAGPEL